MPLSRRLVPLLFGLCALAPAAASASFPAGVWGLVEKVVVDPDGLSPNRVRIEGLFIVANQKPDFAAYPGYSEPSYGYMDYDCPADQLKTCAMEWADLTVASQSDNKCRGWGDNSFPSNGTVRPFAAPPAEPDVYPISMGVLIGFSPCEALTQWMVDHPPPPVEETTGGTEGTSGGTEGTSGGTGGGSEATGGGTGEATSDPGPSSSTTAPAETGSMTTDSAGTGGPATDGGATASDPSAGGSSGTTSPQGDSGGTGPKDAGCACRTDGPGGAAGGALALLGLLALRRRR